MVSLMGEWLEKYAKSVSFWILVIVAFYFAYSTYFAASGMRDSIQMISNQDLYHSLSQNSWWWTVLFYGSEGISGSIAIISRSIAGAFAVYSAFLFWRKKDTSMPTIKKSACWALLFEAVFFIALIPAVIAAFAYNLTTENLYYFGHTPGLLLIYGTAAPCLAMVLTAMPLLLKLRSTIKKEAPTQEIIKWTALTGLAYLFVVFWFNYSMLWAATLVPYPQEGLQWGFSFLWQPANFVSFVLTVFGLLAVAVTALWTAFPTIKKLPQKINLTYAGAVMVAVGGFFLFSSIYYYITGGYFLHPSVWYEVIGPPHNPNLWALAFVFVGVPLIIQGRMYKPIATAWTNKNGSPKA